MRQLTGPFVRGASSTVLHINNVACYSCICCTPGCKSWTALQLQTADHRHWIADGMQTRMYLRHLNQDGLGKNKLLSVML